MPGRERATLRQAGLEPQGWPAGAHPGRVVGPATPEAARLIRRSSSDSFTDASEMVVDVVDEDVGDDLLRRHGRCARDDGAAVGELVVAERADDAGGDRGPLRVQLDRLGPGAVGMLLGVLRI